MSRKHLKTAAKSSFWKGDLDVVDQIVVVAQPDPLPHDKHPRNWSRPRKLFIAFLTCNLLVAVEMYGSLYASQRPLNLGIAIGSLIGAPLSSLIGRRLTYILSAVCFTAFTAGSSFSSSITTLLVFRFIAAFFGATAFPNYVLTLADLFTPEDKTPILAIALTVTCSTPTFGPIPGSYLGSLAPWPWTFALSAFWAGILAVILLFIPETDLNVIRRYHRKLKEGKSTWEVLRPQLVTKNTWQKLLTPLTLLILEPIILWTALYHAFIYGLFFILLQAIPFIYQRNYQFTPGNIGLVFLAPWIGNLIGAILYFGLLQPYHAHQTRRLQSRNTKSLSQDPLAYVQVALKPEARLPGLLGGSGFPLLWSSMVCFDI
ncbi:multidrug transporter [Coprinopsis cinerea AmutBmut pab1-1]|nr:multidrug transporter [Coprinopsis cinerea AmutBmut pab1-1]